MSARRSTKWAVAILSMHTACATRRAQMLVSLSVCLPIFDGVESVAWQWAICASPSCDSSSSVPYTLHRRLPVMFEGAAVHLNCGPHGPVFQRSALRAFSLARGAAMPYAHARRIPKRGRVRAHACMHTHAYTHKASKMRRPDVAQGNSRARHRLGAPPGNGPAPRCPCAPGVALEDPSASEPRVCVARQKRGSLLRTLAAAYSDPASADPLPAPRPRGRGAATHAPPSMGGTRARQSGRGKCGPRKKRVVIVRYSAYY